MSDRSPSVPTTHAMPPLNTRGVCENCGKAVWLRQVAINGYTSATNPGAPIFGWVSRKGTKPTPRICFSTADPGLRPKHHAKGYRREYI